MTTSTSIPELDSTLIKEEIHDIILNKLFGSEYNNVKSLLETIAQIEQTDRYEFEIRFSQSVFQPHIDKQFWLNFHEQLSDKIVETEYTDDIIYNYEPYIPLQNIYFRSFERSKIYERKTLITMIKSRTTEQDITPLIIKLSNESLMSPSEKLNIISVTERRQRLSYKFKNPALQDWRIDSTIRLWSKDVYSKKSTQNLEYKNVLNPEIYDTLDIEFEYIGSFKNIKDNFFELIKNIYTSFELFDSDYLLVKRLLSCVLPNVLSSNNILSIIPKPVILTNDVLQTINVTDYKIFKKYSGCHAILVIFSDLNNPSKILVISDEFTETIYITNSDEANLLPSLKSNIRKFVCSKNTKRIECLTVFEIMFDKDANLITLTDILLMKNKLIANQTFNERINVMNAIDINIPNYNIQKVEFKDYSSWLELIDNRENYICKRYDESLLDSTIYKLSYHEQITFNFKVQYIPIKNIFYLYSIGSPISAIETKTIVNKFSSDHFGYSLVSLPSSEMYNDYYMLYVSPYMLNSYILKNNVNEFAKQIYADPLKYNGKIIKCYKDVQQQSWIPIAISSHAEPEAYIDLLRLESLIFDPLKNPLKHANPSITNSKDIYNLTYKLLDQFVVEKLIPKNTTMITFINDNNVNIDLLYNIASINTVYAISSNKHTLTSFIEQSINKKFNKTVLLNTSKLRSEIGTFNTQVVCSNLNPEIIIPELNKIYCYSNKSIDLLLFQDDEFNLNSLMDVIRLRVIAENVLSPNGKILIKYFDGNRIEESINNKVYKKGGLKLSFKPPPRKALSKLKSTFGTNIEVDNVDDLKNYVNQSIVVAATQHNLTTILNHIVEYRINTPQSTVVYYKGALKPNQSKLFDYITDDKHFYVIFPNFTTKEDRLMLIKYYNEFEYKYYTYPDVIENTYIDKLVFKPNFFELLNSKFKYSNVCNPLTYNEIASYISTNRQFSKLDLVKNVISAYSVIEYERL